MKIRLYFYFFTTMIFFAGCSQNYALIQTDKLQNLQKQVTTAEQNLSQTFITNLTQTQTQNEENLKQALEYCHAKQYELFEQLREEIKTLKSNEQNGVNKEGKKQPSQPKTVIKEIKTLHEKLVVGSVEKVHIYPSDFVMDARIDTGAETSSIDARQVEEFERDGKKWVRFVLPSRDNGELFTIEREIVRYAKIIQSSLNESLDKRIVVSLKLAIGDRSELVDFTLTNREHMTFGVLIGRNVIKDAMVVDVSEDYLAPLVLKKEEGFKK